MNSFYLTGRIMESPEKLETENGTKLCRLKISVENKNDTDIYEVAVFRNLVEENYEAGQFIAVNGRLVANNFTNEDKSFYRVRLIGNAVELVNG